MAWTAEQFRAHYREKVSRLIALFGGVCMRCGVAEGLEFHHRHPQSKVANVTSIIRQRWATVVAEAKKCDLLCGSCHDLIHPHTTPDQQRHGCDSRFSRACRCDICRAYRRVKIRNYKRLQREQRGYARGPYRRRLP